MALRDSLAKLTISALATSIFGVAFIYRCEQDPTLPGGYVSCWIVGGAIAGVPLAQRIVDKSKFLDGFNTYNPALRRPEDQIDLPDLRKSKS